MYVSLAKSIFFARYMLFWTEKTVSEYIKKPIGFPISICNFKSVKPAGIMAAKHLSEGALQNLLPSL